MKTLNFGIPDSNSRHSLIFQSECLIFFDFMSIPPDLPVSNSFLDPGVSQYALANGELLYLLL